MKRFRLALCALLVTCALAACGGTQGVPGAAEPPVPQGSGAQQSGGKQALRDHYLEKANQVTVTDKEVTFSDAACEEGETKTLARGVNDVVILYPSYTALWYEAGGTAAGVIGGETSAEQYKYQIGRDITQDEGVDVVADGVSATHWDIEKIIGMKPDLIICSPAAKGYSTIKGPAEAAGIPVIAVDYENFQDYLKWFKVFQALGGSDDARGIAEDTLDQVVQTVLSCPEKGPRTLPLMCGPKSLEAQTANTAVGAMLEEMHATSIVDGWPNARNVDRLDVSMETLVSEQPEKILISHHTAVTDVVPLVKERLGADDLWDSLDAVKNDDVYVLDPALFHNRPNHRYAEAYKALAEALYGDQANGEG